MLLAAGVVKWSQHWYEVKYSIKGRGMSVTICHKGVSPISSATIWAIDGDYLPVEWTVVLVSLLSAVAFVIAMRLTPNRKCVGGPSSDTVMSNRCGQSAKDHAGCDDFATGPDNAEQQRVAGAPVLAR
jgi:hypothetical protein